MNKPEADLVQMRIFIQNFSFLFRQIDTRQVIFDMATWDRPTKKRWNCPILRKFQIQKSYLKVFDIFTSWAEAVSDLKFEKWIRNVLN